MRRRLGLAAALLRAPRLLVLDEPTNGLDPHGMREVRDLLAELVAGGTTVFLSSHLLAEVELVCTRAAILDRGRLVAQDRVAALLGPTGRVLVTTPDVGAAADLAAALPGVRLGERRPDRLAVHLDGTSPRPSTGGWSTAASASASWWSSARPWRTCSCASPGGAPMFLVELHQAGRPGPG